MGTPNVCSISQLFHAAIASKPRTVLLMPPEFEHPHALLRAAVPAPKQPRPIRNQNKCGSMFLWMCRIRRCKTKRDVSLLFAACIDVHYETDASSSP